MESLFNRLLTTELFALALVFCRIGTIFMIMPGIGESIVFRRARLMFALATTVLITPVLAPFMPKSPETMLGLITLVVSEIAIGVFIGLIMRIMMSALDVAGTIISTSNGLASATIFNPMISEPGSLIGITLASIALLLMFQTDLHHLMLRAVVDSYSLFVPGNPPPIGDMSQTITTIVARAFKIGLQLAAPVLIVITIMMVALGILSRLMPQLQIFFISLPLQLIVGFVIIIVTLPTLMLFFLGGFSDTLSMFLQPK